MTTEDLHKKIDGIVENITEIRVSQARTEVIMDEHIRRTAAAEENLEIIHQELKPLKAHVQLINTIAKILVFSGSLFMALKQLGWLEFLGI